LQIEEKIKIKVLEKKKRDAKKHYNPTSQGFLLQQRTQKNKKRKKIRTKNQKKKNKRKKKKNAITDRGPGWSLSGKESGKKVKEKK